MKRDISSSADVACYEIAVDPCNNVWVTGAVTLDSIGMNGSTLIHTATPGGDPLLLINFNGVNRGRFVLIWM